MSALAALDPAALRSELERSDPAPLLVDFWASWCGTCRLQEPAVAAVAERHREALRVGCVDVEAHPEIAADWKVQGLPTLLLIKAGTEVLRITKFQSEASLTAALAPHLDAAESGEGKH